MRLALIQTKQNSLYDFQSSMPLNPEKVALLQKEMMEQNYRLIREAQAQKCDLIVTSEAINFSGQPKRLGSGWEKLIADTQLEILKHSSMLAKEAGSYLIAGMYRLDEENRMRNSAVIFDRNGEILDIYNKIHLAGDENGYLIPGNRFVCFNTEFGRIGVCICWDAQFPETHRALALEGAHLVACPTWGWEAVYGHARAYENGIHVAAAMAVPFHEDICGIRNPSEVIGPDGTVLFSASRENAQALICDFDPQAQHELWSMRMSGRKPGRYGVLLSPRINF